MIIGLSGYAQSGKDTIAGMLIGLHKYNNRAFANPMRESLYILNPIVTSTLGGQDRLQHIVDEHGWEYAKKYTDARRLLQVFGTEVGRKLFGEDFWVNQVFKGISSADKIVFTDVRFPNEAQMIKHFDGQVWRVLRPGYSPLNDHPSESAMDDWLFDKVIINDAGLESLKSQIASNLEVASVL